MSEIIVIIFALFLIIVGLIGTYAGYRVFKLYLAFIGFVTGFTFVVNVFNGLNIFSLLLGLFLGFFFAGLSYVFYKFAIFLAFAYLGSNISFWLLGSALGLEPPLLVTVIGIIGGVIIAFMMLMIKIDRPAIALVTALLGAYYITIGLAGLLDNSLIQASLAQELIPSDLEKLGYIAGKAAGFVMSNDYYLVAYAFFAFTGIFTQLRKWLK